MTEVKLTDEASRRLTQVSRALTNSTSLDETLQLTVECAADILDSELILLLLKNPDGLLEIRASHGLSDDAQTRIAEPMDELLLERLRDVFGASASERFVGVPLVVGGEITGLLAARRAADIDSKTAEWLLSALADQASIALEAARHSEARSSLEERVTTLADSAQAKEQALRILSHDLRSPLSTIMSYTELLDSEMLGSLNERQHAALARMRESGGHLLSLLQNVLEMSRLTAGAIRVDATRFDLRTALREALTIVLTPGTERASLDVATPVPVWVHADPLHVRQTLIQLLDNALKYTPVNAGIRVSCFVEELSPGGWGVVRIEDEGPGIPPDQLGHIFEPYRRAVAPDSSTPAGSGLGLAIARGLVEQMGGSVEVDSQVGQGTVFAVRLPLAAG